MMGILAKWTRRILGEGRAALSDVTGVWRMRKQISIEGGRFWLN